MFFNLFKKKFIDESFEDQKKELEENDPFSNSPSVNGKSCDSLFNNKEDFGHIANNPIPVNGVIGEMKYLNRLRCECGVGLMYHRLGSIGVDGINAPVDIYETVCINGKHWDILYLHLYYPRRSTWLPTGYKFSDFHPIFCKFAIGYGINSYDRDFPFGLGEKYMGTGMKRFDKRVVENYENIISDRNKFIKPEDYIKKCSEKFGKKKSGSFLKNKQKIESDLGIKNYSKKCHCNTPLCRKCLGLNCSDDNCKVHTIENKIKTKLVILDNLKKIQQKIEKLIKEDYPKEKLEALYDYRRLSKIKSDIKIYSKEINRLFVLNKK